LNKFSKPEKTISEDEYLQRLREIAPVASKSKANTDMP